MEYFRPKPGKPNSKRLKTFVCCAVVYLTALTCLIAGCPCPVMAQENLEDIIEGFDDDKQTDGDNELDNVLEGFEEQTTSNDVVADSMEKDAGSVSLSLDGYAKLRSTYNYAHKEPEAGETDWRGFSSLRSELMLAVNSRLSRQWQAKISAKGNYDAIYDINGRHEYTDEVRKNYIQEFELLDTYVQGSPLKFLDLKLGRQIVIWGKSDNIRVTDVLNPLDLREFGATDIEDLRLPLTMIRSDCYWSNWSLTGIFIPEIRFNKNPEYGSDFYPSDIPPFDEDVPESGIENAELAISINGIFSGWDIAFYWADLYDDTPYLYYQPGLWPPEFSLRHARINMIGMAGNIALGNWLLKAEAAYFEGLEFFGDPEDRYTRLDTLAGIEYAGFRDTSIGVEVVNRQLQDYDEALSEEPDNVDENEVQSAIRVTKNWLNDTLTLTLLASAFGSDFEDGSFQRYSMAYDLTDNVSVTGAWLLYKSGDHLGFDDIGDNDRVIVEVKLSF